MMEGFSPPQDVIPFDRKRRAQAEEGSRLEGTPAEQAVALFKDYEEADAQAMGDYPADGSHEDVADFVAAQFKVEMLEDGLIKMFTGADVQETLKALDAEGRQDLLQRLRSIDEERGFLDLRTRTW